MPRGALTLGRKRMPISNYVVTNKSNRQVVATNPASSIVNRCVELLTSAISAHQHEVSSRFPERQEMTKGACNLFRSRPAQEDLFPCKSSAAGGRSDMLTH